MSEGPGDPRRRIPSLDRLLEAPAFERLRERFPRGRLVAGLRNELERVRRLATDGDAPEGLGVSEHYARAVAAALDGEDARSLRPVVNATGVVLHTNLGRAPLAPAALEAMQRAGAGYTNLEYDLERGARGSRYLHCAALLRELTGAEAALVVNNNAAALVLAVNTAALGREVLVSRGELVEIGGSFRVHEILERSGARLREVGSTNRTRPGDYRAALSRETGAILKVHRSNFRISGFAEEADLRDLAELSHETGVPLLHDLGSGLLAEPESVGLSGEPRVTESLAQGADVVSFSGDKLLGGPQAGILLGREAWIEPMRQNPLCRALRVDKVTLAGLEATLRLYREPERALAEIPALTHLARSAQELEARARALAARLDLAAAGAEVEAAPGTSVVGGGTCPEARLPSWTVRLRAQAGGTTADALARRLREASTPVVARIEDDRVVLDLRTVRPDEEAAVLAALHSALGIEADTHGPAPA